MLVDLPYIGGGPVVKGSRIKEFPEDFFVEEIPLFPPSGEGDHIYFTIRRQQENTRDVQLNLAKWFHLTELDVGYAGLKDRHALTVQTFSVLLPGQDLPEAGRQLSDQFGYTILNAERHPHKLRMGHLKGNRFRILVRCDPIDVDSLQPITSILMRQGVPNFFGEQRFGKKNQNVILGRRVITGTLRLDRWKRDLMISAYQSHLFNLWLANRIRDGLYDRLISGDVARKKESGGLFLVENPEEETQRFELGEIDFTGPMFGVDMIRPAGMAAEREDAILRMEKRKWKDFERNRISGSRRPARIFPDDLKIDSDPDGLLFSFTLPPGAYATTLLREYATPSTTFGDRT